MPASWFNRSPFWSSTLAADFDGTTGALLSTVSPSLPLPWVIQFWFYPRIVDADQVLWNRQDHTDFNAGADIRINAAGTMTYRRHTLTINRGCTTSVDLFNGPDTWYLVTAFDDALNRAIWINGTGKGTGTGTVSTTLRNTAWGARQASATPTFAEFYNGLIAEAIEWKNDGAITGVPWTQDDVEAIAKSCYNGRVRGERFFQGPCRHTQFLRDENVSLMMPGSVAPTTFAVTGSVGIAEHPLLWDPWRPQTHLRIGPVTGAPEARRFWGMGGGRRIVGASGIGMS